MFQRSSHKFQVTLWLTVTVACLPTAFGHGGPRASQTVSSWSHMAILTPAWVTFVPGGKRSSGVSRNSLTFREDSGTTRNCKNLPSFFFLLHFHLRWPQPLFSVHFSKCHILGTSTPHGVRHWPWVWTSWQVHTEEESRTVLKGLVCLATHSGVCLCFIQGPADQRALVPLLLTYSSCTLSHS